MDLKRAVLCLCLFSVVMTSGASANASASEQRQELVLPEMLLHSLVCATHIAVDTSQAYAEYKDEAIFWTFNFSFFPGGGEGKWLGCLRYYFRNTRSKRFVGTVASSVLVPCTTEEGKVTRMATKSQSNATQAIPPYPTQVQGLPPRYFGRFEGGYIKCKLDIRAHVINFGHSLEFPRMLKTYGLNYADGKAAIENTSTDSGFPYTLTHEYQVFTTIAAVGGPNDTLGKPEAENPLVNYVPDPTMTSEPGVGSFGFAIPALKSNILSYSATLQSTVYTPTVPLNIADCSFSLEDESGVYVRNQFVMDGNPEVAFGFQYWSDSKTTLCKQADVQPVPQKDTVIVYIGPSTLYIGYDPNTKAKFVGDMYEVFFDPDSASKEL